LKEDQVKKEKRDRTKIGTVICGRYTGNIYSINNVKYRTQNYLTSFFMSDTYTYSNHMFDKVKNIQREFVIMKMSKYQFLRFEDIINAYIADYEMYKNMYEGLDERISQAHTDVITKTEDIAEEHAVRCKEAMGEIKNRLNTRLKELLNTDS